MGGSGGGGRELGQFSHLRGKGSGKKRGCFLSLILKDRVHAMTLANQLTHKHIQIFQKITAELQKFYNNVYQTNDFRLIILGNKKVFEKNSNWVVTDASGFL